MQDLNKSSSTLINEENILLYHDKVYISNFLYIKDRKLQNLYLSSKRFEISLPILFIPPTIIALTRVYASFVQYTKIPNSLTFLTGVWTLFSQIMVGIILLILLLRERKRRITKIKPFKFKYESEMLFLSESLFALGMNTFFSFGFALSVYSSSCRPNQFLLGYLCPNSGHEIITNVIYIFLFDLYPIIVGMIFKSVSWTVLCLCWLFNVIITISYFTLFDKSTSTVIFCISAIFVSSWYLYESRRHSLISFIQIWKLQESVNQYRRYAEENNIHQIKDSFNEISKDLEKV